MPHKPIRNKNAPTLTASAWRFSVPLSACIPASSNLNRTSELMCFRSLICHEADRVKFLAVPTAIGVVVREKLRLVIIVGSALWYRSKITLNISHQASHCSPVQIVENPSFRDIRIRSRAESSFPLSHGLVTSCSYVIPRSGEDSHKSRRRPPSGLKT